MNRNAKLGPAQMLGAIVLVGAGVALLPSVTLGQDAPALPGGASSLQEIYQDWRVACQVTDTGRNCALSHQQTRQDGQRVLAVEMQASPENIVRGNLLLPFGLLLDAGVRLQIDEQPATEALPFRTCLPAGCVVPFDLDQNTVDALRAGTTLNITVKTSDGEQDVAFAISLAGFSAALNRVRALVGA